MVPEGGRVMVPKGGNKGRSPRTGKRREPKGGDTVVTEGGAGSGEGEVVSPALQRKAGVIDFFLIFQEKFEKKKKKKKKKLPLCTTFGVH